MQLDQAIEALGHPRVIALVVSDGVEDDDWPENPIDDLQRSRWNSYDVEELSRAGSHSVLYASKRAEAEHPTHRNVRIRVEFIAVRS